MHIRCRRARLPDFVPAAIETLRPLSEEAFPLLEERFEKTTGPSQLRAAYGLAQFGLVEHPFLVSAIESAPVGERDHIVAALKHKREAAIPSLLHAAELATKNKDWSLKTRLATVALYLSYPDVAAQMLRVAAGESFGRK